MLSVDNDTLRLTFSNWTPEEYDMFIRSKQLPEQSLKYDWKTDTYTVTAPARFAHIFGIKASVVDRGWLEVSRHLKDFQKFGVKIGLEAKRMAFWWATGLGKTHLQWELARQIVHKTDGKALLVVPLNIADQTIEIGKDYFDLPPVTMIKSRVHLKEWCADGKTGIAVVNPEKFIPAKGESEVTGDANKCRAVLLDEASLLASGGGVIKWALIKSCKSIEYKYTFTATPMRNEIMDIASQASFLEKIRNEGDVLWTYFKRDKDGNWDLKKHSETAFHRFLAGWSMYLLDPSHYGFDDYLQGLPAPELIEHIIPITEDQRRFIMSKSDTKNQFMLFSNKDRLTLNDRIKFAQVARGFVYHESGVGKIDSEKPRMVADMIRQEAKDRLQPIVWTIFDEESRILEDLLKESGLKICVIHGDIPKKKRPDMINDFRHSKYDAMITKASLLGFGLNFQNSASMIFSGFDDSFEKQFQAVRRAYRYGQKRTVRIHIPYVPELEGVVWANVQRKQANHDRETTIMEMNFKRAMKDMGILK